MTAPPLELPVRACDAVALADVIFRIADGRPFRDDVRNQVGGALSARRFESLLPFPGSLAQHPVHALGCFVAADALIDGVASALLLRIAPAEAPAGKLFPIALPIARSCLEDGREIAIDAIPFSPSNHREIRTFASEIDTAFLPRSRGVQPMLAVATDEPETGLPAAFQAFRQVFRGTGHNLASVVCTGPGPERLLDVALWAAIRAGWREGFSAGLRIPLAGGLEAARQTIRREQHYSQFILSATRGDFEELDLCVQLHAFITETKAGHRPWKHFDLELSLTGSGVSAPDDVTFCLEWLKRHGCPAQSIAPDLEGVVKIPQLESYISALAAAVRPFNATLTLRGRPFCPMQSIERIAHAASGRLNYEVALPVGAPPAEIADTLTQTAACLRG